jgi:hypothetical protein
LDGGHDRFDFGVARLPTLLAKLHAPRLAGGNGRRNARRLLGGVHRPGGGVGGYGNDFDHVVHSKADIASILCRGICNPANLFSGILEMLVNAADRSEEIGSVENAR